MNMQQNPIFVQPEAGKNLHFPGGDMASIMLSGEQTDRALAVAACTQAPDSGPPLHIHKNEDELFLLAEGHYSFLLKGAGLKSARAGSSTCQNGSRIAIETLEQPLAVIGL